MLIEELSSQPQVLTLYPRALINSLLPRKHQSLPTDGLRLAGVRPQAEHLERYRRVCGFSNSQYLPVTYPHMLAFPLHMALMTQHNFPYPLLGLVHIANRIEQYRPLPTQQGIDIECYFGAEQEHEKGRVFSIITQAHIDGEKFWESQSSMLHRGKSSISASARKAPLPPPPSQATWALDEDLGRRYARASGDYNPIHLHALSARLFGFNRAIAHGMWSKARCLAALDAELAPAYSVDVQFKLPILLPASVDFSHQRQALGLEFALHDHATGKPHLSAQVHFL